MTWARSVIHASADCVLCAQPIPWAKGDRHAIHHACGLRLALGGVGHVLNHRYWCEDRGDSDAGLTPRQSALALWILVDRYGPDMDQWTQRIMPSVDVLRSEVNAFQAPLGV